MSSVTKNSIEAGTKDSNNEELLQPISPVPVAVSHSTSSVTSDNVSKLTFRTKYHLVDQTKSPATGDSVGQSKSPATGDSVGQSKSPAAGDSVGQSKSPAAGDSVGQSKSPATGDSVCQSKSPATGDSVGQSKSPATGDSVGQSKSPATGDSVGQSKSPATGDSFGQSKSPATGDSFGQSKSPATGDSFGQSKSPATGDSFGQSKSPATGDSFGQSKSPATGDSFGQSKSPATGDSFGQSKSPVTGDSFGQSASPATGDSFGQSASPAKEDSTRQSASPAKEDSTRQPASPAKEDSTRQPASPAKEDSTRQPASPAKEDSTRQPASPAKKDSTRQPMSPAKEDSVGEFESSLTVDFIVDSIIPPSPEATFQKSFEMEDTPCSSNPLTPLSVSFGSSGTERTLMSPSVNIDKFYDPEVSGSTQRYVDNMANSMPPRIHSHQEKSISLSDIDVPDMDFVSCTQSDSFTHEGNVTSKENYLSGISTSSYASALSQISPLSFRTVSSVSKEADLTETRKLKTVGTQVGNTPMQSDTPLICSKHKVAVISEDTTSVVPTAAPDLCLSCSKSMLSYIVLIQKFLEGLATNICRQIDPLTHCFECVKENLNLPIQSSHTCKHHDLSQSEVSSTRLQTKSKRKSASSIESKTQIETTETQRDNSRDISAEDTLQFHHGSENTYYEKSPNAGQSSENESQQTSKTHQNYSGEPERRKPLQSQGNMQESTNQPAADGEKIWQHEQNLNHQKDQGNVPTSGANQKLFQQQHQQYYQQQPFHQQQLSDSNRSNQCFTNVQQYQNNAQGHNQQQQNYFPAHISETQTVNDLQVEQHYPGSEASGFLPPSTSDHILDYTTNADRFQKIPSPIISYGEGTDGILSTLYKVERSLKDMPNDLTVWERVADIQDQVFERNNNEAFVTIARNNAEALGCLVLGASLLLCGTSRTTCVLMSDNVHSDFVNPLSSLFHVVLHTRSLDSVGTTKLSLLDQPELGVTFGKLNVWRLEQFTKCVFLNPDTVVIQNCDELFCHEELSAVPDIGWPDCFNSGVFVFKPSVQTFWELLEFSDKQRSYDGGEQGLLNSYFNSWSTDISTKLSFIYNLMANVSYTYTPAFKQFGRSVKVVQFWGPFKPWHVKFDHTGQIAQSSIVHPTYVQFVRIWLNLFRVCILPQFSPDILSFTSSQSSLSAYELLRFFPSPVGSDTEFLLIPPSVRVRPNMQSLQTAAMASTAIEKLQLPVTSNLNLIPSSASEQVDQLPPMQEDKIQGENIDLKESESADISISEPRSMDDTVLEGGELTEDSAKTGIEKPKSLIPGAEVGDYQGMLAWEQGRMDYEGEASSDTIIQRLRYLMGKPDRMS